MPEIIIREAKLEDAGGIAQLSDELGYPTTLEDVRLSISQIIESQQNQSFVALSLDETVVGWIHIFVTIRLTSEPFRRDRRNRCSRDSSASRHRQSTFS